MGERITRGRVDDLAASVSRADYRIMAQRRSGYTGLDVYIPTGESVAGVERWECQRALICGTTREVYTYLRGMQAAQELGS